MTDLTQPIEIDRDDKYIVSVSAHIQSFKYKITLYPPDGNGGYQAGQIIALGDNATSQWIGTGAQIEGAIVETCVTHGGNTQNSEYDIKVRLQLERSPGVVETLKTWTILRGLPSGESKCLALAFK